MDGARKERLVTGSLLALAFAMYAAALVGRHLSLWQSGDVLELTFNSMLEHLLHHPQLAGPRRVVLRSRDGRGLYERLGFAALPVPELWMERPGEAWLRRTCPRSRRAS